MKEERKPVLLPYGSSHSQHVSGLAVDLFWEAGLYQLQRGLRVCSSAANTKIFLGSPCWLNHYLNIRF